MTSWPFRGRAWERVGSPLDDGNGPYQEVVYFGTDWTAYLCKRRLADGRVDPDREPLGRYRVGVEGMSGQKYVQVDGPRFYWDGPTMGQIHNVDLQDKPVHDWREVEDVRQPGTTRGPAAR